MILPSLSECHSVSSFCSTIGCISAVARSILAASASGLSGDEQCHWRAYQVRARDLGRVSSRSSSRVSCENNGGEMVISECYEVSAQCTDRATPGRRASRGFQPGIDGTLRLESRELLHGGPVVGHASAVVGGAEPLPVDPTLQQVLAVSYADAPGGNLSVSTRDATILVPTGLVPGRTYPLVVATEWDGSPITAFQVWWKLAEENEWIVYASKDYQNSVLHGGIVPSENVASRIIDQVNSVSATLPVDRSRIFFTGFSGGANFADFLNLRYPGYAAGVIINSDRSWPNSSARRRGLAS